MQMNRSCVYNKKTHMCLIMIAAFVIALFAISIYTSYNWMTVSQYTYMTEKLQDYEKLRMVVLADLHDHEFGTGNVRLIQNVAKQDPDVILLAGDFLNNDSEDGRIPCEVIAGLSEVAPVYYALGNHELEYVKKQGQTIESFVDELENAGAVFLDKDYCDIVVNDIPLRLGGMYDYAFGLNGNNDAEAAPEEVRNFLEDFQDTAALKVMMCHRPDSFCLGNASEYWDVDLVIAAHNHGGQVVLPGVGGLYGGDQGWFPEYVHGIYELGNMNLFVTSGLSSNPKLLPRFNNRPEIAVLEICGK